MAIIPRKRKDGSVGYQVKVKDRLGRWLPTKTFDRKKDADAYERKITEESCQGVMAVEAAARKLTFGQYYDDWAVTRGGKSLSEGWKKTQDQMARDYLLPLLSNVRLEELSRWHVERLLHYAETLGRGPATRTLIFNFLHSILGRAVKMGILARNPATIDLKPIEPKIERNFLKPDHLWQLLKVSQSHYLGPAIWLASLAGLRCEAIQALRWNCVDLDAHQILIKVTYKRKANKLGLPKGKDAEYVPIASALADYLKEVRANNGTDGYVASAKEGGMLDHNKFIKGLTALCQQAGVPRVTPHELRHSCTELYIEKGASIEDIRRLLNHKDSETTQRYIPKSSPNLRQFASEIVMPTAIAEARPKLTLIK